MDKIVSCEFNIDIACVEVKYVDGSLDGRLHFVCKYDRRVERT